MNIKIFCVFHKNIDEFIFRHFEKDDFLSIFSLYAVNEKYQKRINGNELDLKNYPNLILEYKNYSTQKSKPEDSVRLLVMFMLKKMNYMEMLI
jgi:hypothetical protein